MFENIIDDKIESFALRHIRSIIDKVFVCKIAIHFGGYLKG